MDMISDGNAYVICDELKKDTFIPRRHTYRALKNDVVMFRLTPSKSSARRQSGEVVSIVERTVHEYSGILEWDKNRALFAADDKKMPYYIQVPYEKTGDAKEGEKVIVRFTKWNEHDELPRGEVIKVLGLPGEHGTEMDSIIYEYDIETEFSDEALEETHNLNNTIDVEELKHRKDFRDTLTFTIDPDDAKDFDDALSFKILANGNYEIGVHIADVTHYVTPGSALERTAQERATSVYLVDRVVPMLPEKISNQLCSLRPDEDKLTFSTVFEISKEHAIVRTWYGKSIIHSHKRFTYDQVQEILDRGEGTFADELIRINAIAKTWQAARYSEGAINFDSDEIKITLNEAKEPVKIEQYLRKDAHKLIEEFMLMANKKVAEVLNTSKFTSVNRVHDAPENEKLADLSRFAQRFGYTIDTKNDRSIARSINNMLKDSEGKAEQHIISHFAVRSMPKAYYTVKKSGHYGLAFEHYAHFTSPIRRYPDMMTHRLLEAYLHHRKGEHPEVLESLCKHSSEKEVNASEAERASKKFKQMEYLQRLLGTTFEAIISGTTEWGIYAEIIENKCEGMIRLITLTDDMYTYDATNYAVTGKRSGRTYKIGDKVKIKVVAADPVRRQADFEMVEKLTDNR